MHISMATVAVRSFIHCRSDPFLRKLERLPRAANVVVIDIFEAFSPSSPLTAINRKRHAYHGMS